MTKLKKYIIVVLVLFLSVPVFSQKDTYSKAEAAFQVGKFFEAIDLYKYAFGKVKDKKQKPEIIFKVGLCYKLTSNNKQAEIWFRKSIQKNYNNPLAYLYLAEALKINQKYEDAIVEFENYKRLVPDDPRGDDGVLSCKSAQEWINKPTRYKVENMYYFNTKWSDIAPAYAKEDYKVVFFTSTREGSTGNKIHQVTGEYYADLYYSRADRKGRWSEAVLLPISINTEFDEGIANLNKKGNTMFFTSFRKDKNGKLSVNIYMSKKDGIDWTEPVLVEAVKDSVTVAHPTLSADELTLYFVSDMKGGQGGKDIWKITRSNATGMDWGEPVNVGPSINTAGDEMYPYVHEDGTFYFSSNGHLGMGGLDIFMAIDMGNGNWKIENMKYPINSAADDFSIIFEGTKERGYFSSNREGGKGSDDIYQFNLPPIEYELSGLIRNQKTDEIIAAAEVNLIGSDGTNNTIKSETDGTFKFTLKPNTDYRIVTRRGGFLNGKGKESTKGVTDSKVFKMDIYMSPDDSRIVLPNILYDFGKWDLRPESLVSLEELVEILNDMPNITIEIGSHTDNRGSDEANMDLSAKRAQSVVDFLITYGIDSDRLTSKGYGETSPKVIEKREAAQYPFLKEGDVLTEAFINRLASKEEQEMAHQINRRTDFGVTGRDYVQKVKRKR